MQTSAQLICVSQQEETRATAVTGPHISFRYAYGRSAESQSLGDPGQDYLVIKNDPARIAFAVCDGVGMSFFGDIAARILGGSLVEWLWQANLAADSACLHQDLDAFLRSLTAEATACVQVFALPADLPPLLGSVLEKKRGKGSESMFTAGCLDVPAGRLFLTWMGDSRLSLWDDTGAPLWHSPLHTHERWSSRNGPVGDLHSAVFTAGQVFRLVTYTDGLAALDGDSARPLESSALDRLIQATFQSTSSDDISYLEILYARPALQEPVQARVKLWNGQS